MKANNLLLKINQEQFESIPEQYRLLFEVMKIEPDDSELFENDTHYSKLMKEYRKSSKELRDYKFDKRNK